MDDDWREDGSLRDLNAGGGGGGKGKARGKGKGPQFTRVIPKFLQKYHQPPAIQAKFATLPNDEEDEGLDEVQQAAIDEYLAKREDKKEKKKKREKEEDGEDEEENTDKKKTKTSGQTVVQMGKATDATKKKKRKRTDRPTLSNKKLLSFSMDDE
ncbi:hypothetical protein PHYSODRAFT_254705 [Phytophthora sojae]|uniref:DUF4604 domain-containing protein n=1 Tax=Phytophthora sojae (strain P6497) TaxID=1094619 RepID=G5A3U4_PHYSP|nr:hypothetical protein PHYSODRAFT_254705 [Phytophthora sojae]EGZ09444.1 hypothetical protein PHYSODRAFT_254705 [Phytophthora sojae]|eukprot:XP_009534305.1 hypothetical protein PHYSODRAFT_254705 [Phytophthora sojae]